MGKVASSLGHRAMKPLREFNLEHRVAKELSREKRPAAPRHQTSAALMEEAVREQSGEVKGRLEKKDDLLYDRLKSVYVTSQDVTPVEGVSQNSPDRPLPTDRTVVQDPEFGYREPKSVPYGKVTLRAAVEAITRHQEDPVLWTPRRLALEYRLSVELTEKVLRHFRMFVAVLPEDKATRTNLRSLPVSSSEALKQLTEGGKAGQDTHGKGKTNS